MFYQFNFESKKKEEIYLFGSLLYSQLLQEYLALTLSDEKIHEIAWRQLKKKKNVSTCIIHKQK